MTVHQQPLKWIKFLVDFFDDEKIKLIEALPERDAILVIWFKLLAVTGKSNTGGLVLLEKRIPFTDEMLSTVFSRPLNTVRLALATFESFGMIVMTEERIIQIEDWDKFQSLDSDGKYREAARKRMAEHRARKALPSKITQHVTQPLRNVTPLDIDKEEDKEKNNNKADVVVFSEIEERTITDLVEIRIPEKKAREIVKRFSTGRVRNILAAMELKPPKNKAAFLVKALEENWDFTDRPGSPTRPGPPEKQNTYVQWWFGLTDHQKRRIVADVGIPVDAGKSNREAFVRPPLEWIRRAKEFVEARSAG